MKRRILCFLLTLCTLLSLFPTIAVASSAQTLPKDESGAGVSAQADGGAVTQTDYDRLYVGADGSKTANGGKLVGLYTAFDAAGASLNLTDGKWKNKMDPSGATDAVLRGAAFWSKNADGSVGVTMDWNTWHGQVKKEAFGLTLPAVFTESDSYTVDTVARVKGVQDTAGKLYSATVANYAFTQSSFRFGWLACTFFPSGHTSTNQTLCGRWYFSSSTFNGGVWGDNEAIGGTHQTPWQDYGFSTYGGGVSDAAIPVAVDYAKSIPAADSEKYTVSYNGTETFNRTLTADQIAKLKTTKADDVAPTLSLYNSVPADVYAVRVYSAALTEAENITNAFIDLAAYYRLDLTGYAALDSSCRSAVANAMSQYGYDAEAAVLGAKLSEVIAALKHQADTDDTLYVKSGLRVLLTAYKGHNTGYYQSEAGVSWFNAAMTDESATLKGSAWTLNENGGFTIVRTLADYQADATFGLYLPGAALPEGSYTTELVFNPTGISTVNDEGELVRYLDDHSPTGQWNEYGIVLGPLRCMHAVAERPVGKDGQFERRWVYRASGGLQDANWKYLWSDQMWGNSTEGVTVGFEDIETLVFEHAYSEGSGSYYRILCNEMVHRTASFDKSKYISPAETGNMFQLMVGMPGTMYAVRVYDRVLSGAERNRNHAADIIYYYGLNTALLDSFLSKMDDDSDIFAAFGDMTFDMEKEEAQAEFDRRVVAIWLSYEGLGVRKDGKDGTRFYFSMNKGSIEDMLQVGYSLELGALLNVRRDDSPVLGAGGYDYKLVAYDSSSGKNAGYYVDDDTFAVTVLYGDLDKKTAIASVRVRGYVKLVSPEGDELLFYSEPDNGSADTPPDSLFSIYNYMSGLEGLQKSHFDLVSSMRTKLDSFYENVTVHVQAGAAAGGNGSKNAPYASFMDAFVKCKELFAKINVPTRVTMDVGDGVYGIYNTVSLSKEEKPYPYTEFIIKSDTGKATFTTTVGVDASLFEETGDNVWTCQLPKDANGDYPLFRYLYVDGKIADIAHSYDDSGVDENTGTAGYDRTFDGVYGNVLQLYQSGRLTEDTQATLFYPATRTDLIATFNEYKNKFLALLAMEALYEAGTLTVDTPSPYTDEALSALFEDLKLHRIAWDDLAEQRYRDPFYNKDKNFGKYDPKASSDEAYVAKFYALRDEIYANWHMDSMDKYLPIVKQKAYTDEGGVLYDDMRHIAKFYIDIDMIGDWREEIAYGLTLLPAKQEADIAAAYAVYEPKLAALNEIAAQVTAKENERKAAEEAYKNAAEADKAAKKAALEAITEALTDLRAEHVKAQNRVNNAKKTYDSAVSRANEYTDPFMQYRFALQHLQIEMHINSQWCFNITHLDGVDYDDTITALDGTTYVACYLNRAEYDCFQLPGGYSQAGRHLYLCNGVKFLDEENEFYYDEETGTIYYYTEKNPRNMTFEIPTNDYLFVLDHAEHITLSGLTFTGVDDYYLTEHGISASLGTEEVSLDVSPDRSALLIRWCDDLTVEDCNFLEIGGEAITARNRVENTLITGCTFEKIGSSAIRLGQHGLNFQNILYSDTEGNEYVTISDNYMNGIAFEYHGSPAIIMPANKNVTITGNTIMNTAYSAMMIGWGFLSQTYNKGEHFNNYEVDISYNYITGFMQEMGDGGAIYVTNGNAREDVGGYFNYIHHNYILFSNTTGNGLGHMMCGLYFDGSSSHWHAHENVVVEQSYGAVLGEDEGFEKEDEAYLAKLRKRYSGTTFAYTQHITDQETFHILYEENYFLNVRATQKDEQKKEIYKTYIVASRYIEERNTHYVNGIDVIPTAAEDIIYSAGCAKCPGDPYLLYDNNY